MENEDDPRISHSDLSLAVELQALIPQYLERRRQELGLMKNALVQDDLQFIELTGHSLKGHAASYGFSYLGEMGAHLERAASSEDRITIENVLYQVETYLDHISPKTDGGI